MSCITALLLTALVMWTASPTFRTLESLASSRIWHIRPTGMNDISKIA